MNIPIMETEETAEVLRSLKILTDNPPSDPAIRKQLYKAAHQLALAVEPPYDTVYRINYSVSINLVQAKGRSLMISNMILAHHPHDHRSGELAADLPDSYRSGRTTMYSCWACRRERRKCDAH
jgi:hypothetical protein